MAGTGGQSGGRAPLRPASHRARRQRKPSGVASTRQPPSHRRPWPRGRSPRVRPTRRPKGPSLRTARLAKARGMSRSSDLRDSHRQAINPGEAPFRRARDEGRSFDVSTCPLSRPWRASREIFARFMVFHLELGLPVRAPIGPRPQPRQLFVFCLAYHFDLALSARAPIGPRPQPPSRACCAPQGQSFLLLPPSFTSRKGSSRNCYPCPDPCRHGK